MFTDVRAPLIPGGRPLSITPLTLEALCDHLLGELDLYLDEIVEFLYDEFDVVVYTSTITLALHRMVGLKSGSTDSPALGASTGGTFSESGLCGPPSLN
jgi:hypothetical protein